MQHREECLSMLMLLPLLLSLSSQGYAQVAKNPQRDLSVTLSSSHEGNDPGSVFGAVKNLSPNAYPCVRIEFDLYTRFDLRPAGEEGRHLGVLPVELQDLQPRGVRDYQQRLPFPAGIALRSVNECPEQPAKDLKELPDAPDILSFTVAPERIHPGQTATLQWRTANTDQVFVGEPNPGWPHTSPQPIRAPRSIERSGSLQVSPSQTVTYRLEAKREGKSSFQDVTVHVGKGPARTSSGTCSISGHLYGRLTWNATDDRGRPVVLTLDHVFIKAPGGVPKRTRVQGGQYTFSSVPAGKTYTVWPGNFQQLRPDVAGIDERSVVCKPNETYQSIDFTIGTRSRDHR